MSFDDRDIEAALRAAARTEAPVEASEGFVARVMARVDAAAAGALAATPATSLSAAPTRTPWWAALATEPMSVVSVTLGVSLALLASWYPQWLTDAAIAFAAQWTSFTSSVNVIPAIHVSSLAWISLGVAATPFLAWGIVLLWRRLERTLIFLTAGRRV